MTQEDKQLLLKDLSARLPYGVKCTMWSGKAIAHSIIETLRIGGLDAFMCNDSFSIKPYLRPMSSMTENERKEYMRLSDLITVDGVLVSSYETFDWLNTHHFDYRGLIKKGLAIEASEGMYKTE